MCLLGGRWKSERLVKLKRFIKPTLKVDGAEVPEEKPHKVLPRKRPQAEIKAKPAPNAEVLAEKAAAEKAAAEKVTGEKAAVEKPGVEKAGVEKGAVERKAAVEKAPVEKAGVEKAVEKPKEAKKPKVLPRKRPPALPSPPPPEVKPPTSENLLKELLRKVAPQTKLSHESLIAKLIVQLRSADMLEDSAAKAAPPESAPADLETAPADALEAAWAKADANELDVSEAPRSVQASSASGVEKPPDFQSILSEHWAKIQESPALLKVQEAMRRTARAQLLLRRKKAEEMMLQGMLEHCKAACKVYQEPDSDSLEKSVFVSDELRATGCQANVMKMLHVESWLGFLPSEC